MTDRERHRDEQAQWFGENIRQSRERRKMSQEALARQMAERGWEWHQSTVYKIEHGTRRTEAFELHDLARILGIPMTTLFRPPAEVAEAEEARLAAARLHGAWAETMLGAEQLFAARAAAERLLATPAGCDGESVVTARLELRIELTERTPDEAIAKGAARYENSRES